MNLKKKLFTILMAVLMAAVLIPTTSVFADNYDYQFNLWDSTVEIPNDVRIAEIGTPVTLTALGYDADHQIIPDNDLFTYEWYFVENGTETLVGTGTTYTIASVEEKDLKSDENDAYYEVRLCYDGYYYPEAKAYLYDKNSFSAEINLSYYHARLEQKAKIYASLTPHISYEDNDITFEWYKASGSNWIHVGSGSVFEIDKVTNSDFGNYRYDAYWNGTKIASSMEEIEGGGLNGLIKLGEFEAESITTAYVAGSPYIEDGVITGTLPDGISYDIVTNTFTLNGYEGTLNCSLLDIKQGDANVQIVGNNTVNIVDGPDETSAIAVYWGYYLTISGTGTLNIHYSGNTGDCSAICCGEVTEIKDCTLNISAEDLNDCFYAIAPIWNMNYDFGSAYAAIKITNATINVDDIADEGSYFSNGGIDAYDEDLSIINSNIHINLQNGAVYGVCAGYFDPYWERPCGGEMYIDNTSTIIVESSTGYWTTQNATAFYQLNFDDLHIYSGDSKTYGSTKSQSDFNYSEKNKGEYTNSDNYYEISSHTWTSKIVKATTSKDGSITRTCSHCGEKDSEIIPSIKSISLDKSSGTYIGECQYGWIVYPTVLDRKGNEIAFKSSETGNFKSVGTHSVKVTSDSELYKFSKTLSYTIVPWATSIRKLSASSKGFTVTWYAQKTQTTGYQIRYATKSSMSKATTVTLKKNTTVSKKITKLKGKTKYYVQVRTYKTVGGKKYCSSWSKKKTVTTKK